SQGRLANVLKNLAQSVEDAQTPSFSTISAQSGHYDKGDDSNLIGIGGIGRRLEYKSPLPRVPLKIFLSGISISLAIASIQSQPKAARLDASPGWYSRRPRSLLLGPLPWSIRQPGHHPGAPAFDLLSPADNREVGCGVLVKTVCYVLFYRGGDNAISKPTDW
ncbi:hypothetical protein, partial [Phyllobacterium trifolii]|uniref:hypothetical protein n=1 Tax=Phyllobacterium trifolii TaxID=300193 RepID=UPI001AEDDDC3